LARHIPDGPGSSGFDDITLLPDSVPELNMEDIELKTSFLGKSLHYPILINALTGGTQEAEKINRTLAYLARKYGLAMAVGSQSIALDKPAVKGSFTVVRAMNPDGVILANLSANSSVKEALEAIKMIEADGLQLHFNVPQELAMSEGDRSFRGVLDKVKRIADTCPVPVIAKEVGFGFSRESIKKLYDCGIRIFDNGGKGGTNFLLIEEQRGGRFDQQLADWGIPTAASLAEIVDLQLPIQIVASGGIRLASDLVKAMAMGAELVGIGSPFLKILHTEGMEALERRLDRLIYQTKAVFLMTGASDCSQIKNKPLIITGRTAEWLRARGVDPGQWCRTP